MELVPGADAGVLRPENTFTPGTQNAGIDAVWGRPAALLLPNNPVSPKFPNCGCRRVDSGARPTTVAKLVPVNSIFTRSQVLSRDEWDIYQRALGGFARTYTEQQAVGREQLDAGPVIKLLGFSLFENCLWTVKYTVSLLTSEDVKSKIKALRGQFDIMFSFY